MASAEALERVMRVKRLVVCLSVIDLIVASGLLRILGDGNVMVLGFSNFRL
jgi:hypothetical protein